MDELIADLATKWSAVDLIAFVLIVKGISTMNTLSDSIKDLSKTVTESIKELSKTSTKFQMQYDEIKDKLSNVNSNIEHNFEHNNQLILNLQNSIDKLLK